MHGYVGKLLEVDLTSGVVRDLPLDAAVARDYIGGSGLAARLYLDRVTAPYPEPFDPANPLIILTGPVAGHLVPGSSRFAVCTRSPLTGLWGESSGGGYLAPALKAAGCDGLIIIGKAARPVYLLVQDGSVVIRDAEGLWGKDTYETDAALKRLHGKQARTLSIGQAGERLVRFAAAVHDRGPRRRAYRHGRGYGQQEPEGRGGRGQRSADRRRSRRREAGTPGGAVRAGRQPDCPDLSRLWDRWQHVHRFPHG